LTWPPDSDGSSFVITFTVESAPGVSEPVFAAIFDLSGSELVRTELLQLSMTGRTKGQHHCSEITSTRSGSGSQQRFFAVWHEVAAGSHEGDIAGALCDTPGPGHNYCVGVPNSTGRSAAIHAAGSISIGLNNLQLSVTHATQGTFGIFFLGLSQMQIPFGEGFRCAGNPVCRITPVITTDAMGAASLQLDFNQPYGALVTPGAPGVNYQFWYRDPPGGPAGFNLSDGLHVQHTP